MADQELSEHAFLVTTLHSFYESGFRNSRGPTALGSTHSLPLRSGYFHRVLATSAWGARVTTPSGVRSSRS